MKSTKGGQVLVHRSCTLKPAKVEKKKKNEENQQEEWGKSRTIIHIKARKNVCEVNHRQSPYTTGQVIEM